MNRSFDERLEKLEQAIVQRPLLVIYHEIPGMSDEQIADIAKAESEGRQVKKVCFSISE